MRFAVQQLLGSSSAVDLLAGVLQRAYEVMPVGLSEHGVSSRFATSRTASATRSMKCGVAISTLLIPVCRRWSAAA